MDEPRCSWNLAAIVGQYTTTTQRYTASGNPGWELMVRADPRRWFIRIDLNFASPLKFGVMPGPPKGDSSTMVMTHDWQEWKFTDCPSICTGEFYCDGGSGNEYLIIQCLYVG